MAPLSSVEGPAGAVPPPDSDDAVLRIGLAVRGGDNVAGFGLAERFRNADRKGAFGNGDGVGGRSFKGSEGSELDAEMPFPRRPLTSSCRKGDSLRAA